MHDVGIVRIDVTIENLHRAGARHQLRDVMVDTGSELTWVPTAVLDSLGIERRWRQHFILADGTELERDVGYAMIHSAGASAVDHVVFAQASDMTLLGSRTLEGLNVKVDVVRKRLVPAGPIVTGASAVAA
jgi:predicted aspartyl protease